MFNSARRKNIQLTDRLPLLTKFCISHFFVVVSHLQISGRLRVPTVRVSVIKQCKIYCIILSTGIMDCKTEKPDFDFNDPEDDKRLLAWSTLPHQEDNKTFKVEGTAEIKRGNGDEGKKKYWLHLLIYYCMCQTKTVNEHSSTFQFNDVNCQGFVELNNPFFPVYSNYFEIFSLQNCKKVVKVEYQCLSIMRSRHHRMSSLVTIA